MAMSTLIRDFANAARLGAINLFDVMAFGSVPPLIGIGSGGLNASSTKITITTSQNASKLVRRDEVIPEPSHFESSQPRIANI